MVSFKRDIDLNDWRVCNSANIKGMLGQMSPRAAYDPQYVIHNEKYYPITCKLINEIGICINQFKNNNLLRSYIYIGRGVSINAKRLRGMRISIDISVNNMPIVEQFMLMSYQDKDEVFTSPVDKKSAILSL